MKTIACLGLLFVASTGCWKSTHHIDTLGNKWVELSQPDDLLPDLRARAIELGCQVHSDELELSYMGELDMTCGGEHVVVSQKTGWLGYRCTALPQPDCDKLVNSFAPQHSPGRGTALGNRGSAF